MSSEAKLAPLTLREFNAVDGYFVLISDGNGDLFAKAYDIRDAKLIAAARELLHLAQRLEAIRDGLNNGNSGAENEACRLAARASAIVVRLGATT